MRLRVPETPRHLQRLDPREVIVVAHRGASGYRPEHTLEAYRLAIAQGADVIEPDLVITRDGVLVARHENEIGGTTDVAAHPEFAERRTTKLIDGTKVTGWFTEDFTLAELRTLRACERLPDLRPGNTLYDGQFVVPTFDEVVELARSEARRLRRRIAVAPETKHPSYFASIGLPLEPALVRSLRRVGWIHRWSPVFVQSFEVANLRLLHRQISVPLVQLTAATGAPFDAVSAGSSLTYQQMMTPHGLRTIRRYASWISPAKDSVISCRSDGSLGAATTLVEDAHRAGLKVMVYTFRAENAFLPTDRRSGTHPAARGDLAGELAAFYAAGIDAAFCDFPDEAVAARKQLKAPRRRSLAATR